MKEMGYEGHHGHSRSLMDNGDPPAEYPEADFARISRSSFRRQILRRPGTSTAAPAVPMSTLSAVKRLIDYDPKLTNILSPGGRKHYKKRTTDTRKGKETILEPAMSEISSSLPHHSSHSQGQKSSWLFSANTVQENTQNGVPVKRAQGKWSKRPALVDLSAAAKKCKVPGPVLAEEKVFSPFTFLRIWSCEGCHPCDLPRCVHRRPPHLVKRKKRAAVPPTHPVRNLLVFHKTKST